MVDGFTLTGTLFGNYMSVLPVFGVLLLSQISFKKSHNVSHTDLDIQSCCLSQNVRAKWSHKMTLLETFLEISYVISVYS